MNELFETEVSLPPWLDPDQVKRYDLHVHQDQDAVNESTGKFAAGVQYFTITAIAIAGVDPLKQWRYERRGEAYAAWRELSINLNRRREGLEVLERSDPAKQLELLGS